VFEALPAGLVVLDGLGRVEDCNLAARSLFGEDPRGALWRDTVARLFRPRPDDGPDLSLAEGRRVHVQTGSLGSVPGQVLVLQDVTEVRLLQDRLGQLERLSAMGEMAARLAHQLRTPLASALLYAGALGRPLSGEDAERYSTRLLRVLRHLESLIRDMLLFARRGSFEVEDVLLGDLLLAVREHLAAKLEAGAVRLEIAAANGETVLRASRQALAGALANLVDNACEAGAATIALTTDQEGASRVGIEVRDDGPGVPPEARARLFEPFYTTRPGGSGLGLAVVRAVAEAHGGTVRLLETGGRGACFRIDLPVWPSPAAERTGARG
jgi:two-component system sensor histidine kinase FlrB